MTALARPLHQRTQGSAQVELAQGRPRRLFTGGSAKAILLAGAVPEVVFLNTAGGLTGGDRLAYSLTTDCDTLATTQTAERAYRAAEGRAEMAITLTARAGRLDWLPQETILFDRSHLHRRTRIDLGATATCLTVEAVVLGRAAMGEVVRDLTLDDRREITRAGRPVMVEPLRLNPGALHGPATLAGARAFASLVLIAPGAQDALGPVRAALGMEGVQGAASGMEGRLMVRLMAADGWPLRRQIARILSVLRPGGLPRVWQL